MSKRTNRDANPSYDELLDAPLRDEADLTPTSKSDGDEVPAWKRARELAKQNPEEYPGYAPPTSDEGSLPSYAEAGRSD